MNNTKDDEVRQVINEAALRVFEKWGMKKTTMEDIAREAGKGKSTLYYYYKSKDEIFYTVVTQEVEKILNKAKEAVKDIIDGKEKIKEYIINTLKEMKRATSVYKIVHNEIRDDYNIIERFKSIIVTGEEEFMRNVLKESVRRNEIAFENEKELNLAAKVIVGLLNSLEFYLFLENRDDEQIDMAAKLIAQGI
jgi:AcrR family transcriptional regulator